MSNEHKTDSISIFLRNEEQKSAIIPDNLQSERKYIILMNDTLQAENRQYIKKINKLENQIEELETDNGKLERCSTYIKGMLKNFVEADKLYKKLFKLQTAYQSEIDDNLISYKTQLFYIFPKMTLMSVLFYIFYCVIRLKFDIPIFFFCAVDKLFTHTFVIYYMFNQSIFSNTYNTYNELNQLKSKIKEINKAQDYIHDLIDTN